MLGLGGLYLHELASRYTADDRAHALIEAQIKATALGVKLKNVLSGAALIAAQPQRPGELHNFESLAQLLILDNGIVSTLMLVRDGRVAQRFPPQAEEPPWAPALAEALAASHPNRSRAPRDTVSLSPPTSLAPGADAILATAPIFRAGAGGGEHWGHLLAIVPTAGLAHRFRDEFMREGLHFRLTYVAHDGSERVLGESGGGVFSAAVSALVEVNDSFKLKLYVEPIRGWATPPLFAVQFAVLALLSLLAGMQTYGFAMRQTLLRREIEARTREIERTNERLALARHVFEYSTLGMLIADADCKVVMVNRAYTRLAPILFI